MSIKTTNYSPWKKSGNDVLLKDIDADVGIGVTSTNYPLEIQRALMSTSFESSVGTNTAWSRWRNTSGNVLAGVESSAGGAVFAK